MIISNQKIKVSKKPNMNFSISMYVGKMYIYLNISMSRYKLDNILCIFI